MWSDLMWCDAIWCEVMGWDWMGWDGTCYCSVSYDRIQCGTIPKHTTQRTTPQRIASHNNQECTMQCNYMHDRTLQHTSPRTSYASPNHHSVKHLQWKRMKIGGKLSEVTKPPWLRMVTETQIPETWKGNLPVYGQIFVTITYRDCLQLLNSHFSSILLTRSYYPVVVLSPLLFLLFLFFHLPHPLTSPRPFLPTPPNPSRSARPTTARRRPPKVKEGAKEVTGRGDWRTFFLVNEFYIYQRCDESLFFTC